MPNPVMKQPHGKFEESPISPRKIGDVLQACLLHYCPEDGRSSADYLEHLERQTLDHKYAWLAHDIFRRDVNLKSVSYFASNVLPVIK